MDPLHPRIYSLDRKTQPLFFGAQDLETQTQYLRPKFVSNLSNLLKTTRVSVSIVQRKDDLLDFFQFLP